MIVQHMLPYGLSGWIALVATGAVAMGLSIARVVSRMVRRRSRDSHETVTRIS